MCLPISMGWQGFTDFLPLLWQPDMFLLTLPSLPASVSCWHFLWVFSGSCFSFSQALPSCSSQKGCAAGKAIFYSPTTLLHSSSLGWSWTVDSFATLDAIQAVAWWTPTPLMLNGSLRSSCSHFTTAPAFLCCHRMLLQPDSSALAQHCACAASQRDLGAEAVCFFLFSALVKFLSLSERMI